MERDDIYAVTTIAILLASVVISSAFLSQFRLVPKDQFIMEAYGSPGTMDPHACYETYGASLDFNIYEGLYTYRWGSSSDEPTVPLLAAGTPSMSADGKQYNITLRQNVRFHDGTSFNASCVRWNVERVAKLSGMLAGQIIEPLKGGSAVMTNADMNGTSSIEFQTAFDDWRESSSAVVVLDAYSIQFNLEQAYSPFIPSMACPVGSMISPSYALSNAVKDSVPEDGDWRNHFGFDFGESETWMDSNTCGTGPYMLDEWKRNEFVRMVIFDDYWRADATEATIAPPEYAGSIRTVYYKTVEGVDSRIMNLRTGVADMVYWPITHADEIWDRDTLRSRNPSIHVDAGNITYTLQAIAFNSRPLNITRSGLEKLVESPFRHRELRKCFAYAFDYDNAIDIIAKGWALEAHGFIPKGMFGHSSSHWLEHHDVEEAVAWWNLAMKNSTFAQDINGMEGYIDLYAFPHDNVVREQLALLMADNVDMLLRHQDVNLTGLTRHHGPNQPPIRIRVNSVSWNVLFRHVLKSKASMWLIGWRAGFADPHDLAMSFVYSKSNGMIASGYCNATLDAWILQAIRSVNRTERLEIYNKIQKQVAYDQPSIYMFQNKQFTVRRSWLKGSGLAFHPMHEIYWYHIYKD